MSSGIKATWGAALDIVNTPTKLVLPCWMKSHALYQRSMFNPMSTFLNEHTLIHLNTLRRHTPTLRHPSQHLESSSTICGKVL